MLERLKKQREVFVAEVDRLKNLDLEAVKNARFELVKETIAEEVKKEHNDKLAAAELKVSHYDFVIAEEEAIAIRELEQSNEVAEENLEG